MRIHAPLLACLAQVACGDDDVPQAELGEVCGVSEPFRVLALEPDQQISYNPPLRAGDRVFYVVKKRGMDHPDNPYPVTLGSTVWTTGPCGESPVQVATGITNLFISDRWPDVVLGYHEDGNVVSLDPLGVAAPHTLFTGLVWGGGFWTQSGVLSVQALDEQFGTLLLHPYPADPRSDQTAPVVLYEPIRIGSSDGDDRRLQRNLLRFFDEFVLAITPEDTLVRIDVADGAMSTVQPGVYAFDASLDGRYVLWQDRVVTGGNAEYREGKVLLRDRSTGTDVFLAETALAYTSFSLLWAAEGLVALKLLDLDAKMGPTRVFTLPGLEFADIPEDLAVDALLDDHRLLTSWVDGANYLFDLRSGAPQLLFPGIARLSHIDLAGDEIHMREISRGDDREEGPLWRVPLGGAAPTKLVGRVTARMRRLPDGRIVSPVNIDEAWLAPLLLIDPETHTELQLDDRVFVYSLDTSQVMDDGLITYSVSDGERSGVYIARLPPQ